MWCIHEGVFKKIFSQYRMSLTQRQKKRSRIWKKKSTYRSVVDFQDFSSNFVFLLNYLWENWWMSPLRNEWMSSPLSLIDGMWIHDIHDISKKGKFDKGIFATFSLPRLLRRFFFWDSQLYTYVCELQKLHLQALEILLGKYLRKFFFFSTQKEKDISFSTYVVTQWLNFFVCSNNEIFIRF